ncbi:MAG: phosphoribosylanthranilate isomerase [Candidatus Eremiobacteraeota bacterium]|nr:phosphoribosylanthranilate isomerase [Candidatus Eremiobacteraeota bacterium]
MKGAFGERKSTRVKFCGITTVREATAAFDAGADAIGVILAPSPRRINYESSRRIAESVRERGCLIAVVAQDLSTVPRLCEAGFSIQFCAPVDSLAARRSTGGTPYLRVIHLSPVSEPISTCDFAPDVMPVFDTAGALGLGGTGSPFRWSAVAGIAAARDVVIAGGLHARNVGACIQSVRPFGVDVRSGIESGGRKSVAKMRAFIAAVREADAQVYG